MPVYNPVEVKIRLKKIDSNPNGEYYIGNSDMDISLLDTVIKVYPPREGEKHGTMVINNTKDREDFNNNDDDVD